MPPNQENTPGQGPGELEVLKQEVQRQTPQEIKQQVDEAKIKAGEVQQALELSLSQRRELLHSFDGRANDPDTLKGKAHDVKKAVIKILFAQEQGKIPQVTGKPPEVGILAGEIITQISSRIKPQDISEQTAPYLFNILSKVINGDIENVQTLAQEFRKIDYLKLYSPELYKRLREAIIKVAESRTSQEEINRLFGAVEQENENEDEDEKERSAIFEHNWTQYYRNLFTSPGDKELLQAIHSPTRFLAYEKKIRKEIEEKHSHENLDRETLDRLVSEKLEEKLILTLAKPYEIVDRDKPQRLFEEIIQNQSDPFYGIRSAVSKIRDALIQLQRHFSTQEEENNPLGFYKTQTRVIKEIVQKERKKREGQTHENEPVFLPYTRVDPVFEGKHVRLSDFLEDLRLSFSEYIELREYLHNVNTIFHQPPGKEGFWSTIKGFAEKLKAGSIDELLLFPDSNIFESAHQLYIKYLEEEFASLNYIHQSDQFVVVKESRTKVQQKVLETLRLMYPDVAQTESWRITTALNIAIGASRGIFFEEPEIAAYADPPVDPETGNAIIRSYYLGDSAPLNPLSLEHSIWRWQFESTTNPIFFLPIEGIDFNGPFDHKVLWKEMQEYRERYLYGTKKEDKKTFMDFIVNMGDIGGPFKRKSWRYEAGFAGLYWYKNQDTQPIQNTDQPEVTTRGKMDYLKTWKNMEYVGYEALWHFINSKNITGSSSEIMKNTQGRNELFSHIFQKYFTNPPEYNGGLNNYLDMLRPKAEKAVKDKIKKAKEKKGNFPSERTFNEAVDREVSEMFLYQTLARVVAQRMPTKFFRLEKNKNSADGIRIWEKLRLKAKNEHEEMFKDPGKFHEAMSDIATAEAVLRKEISEKLQRQGIKKKPFHELGDIRYELDENKLGEILRNLYRNDSQRIDRAEKVFKKMKNKLDQNMFLNDYAESFIRSKKHPFTFGSEEMDLRYISFTAMGPRIIARGVSDMSDVETKLASNIAKFPELLKAVAVSGKPDFSEIVKVISEVRATMENVLGPDDANRIAARLAKLAIAYFKRDDFAEKLMGIGGIGAINSLAGEVAGRSSAVWEWDSVTIDKFLIALENLRILPRTPYELQTKIEYEPKWVSWGSKEPYKLEDITIFGKKILPRWITHRRKADLFETSDKLREEFKGTGFHIALDVLHKYLPIAMILLLYYFISNALKQAFGKKEN